MPRRTPLEVAIARQTEKQARYEGKLRELGLTKACMWSTPALADVLKLVARADRERAEGVPRSIAPADALAAVEAVAAVLLDAPAMVGPLPA